MTTKQKTETYSQPVTLSIMYRNRINNTIPRINEIISKEADLWSKYRDHRAYILNVTKMVEYGKIPEHRLVDTAVRMLKSRFFSNKNKPGSINDTPITGVVYTRGNYDIEFDDTNHSISLSFDKETIDLNKIDIEKYNSIKQGKIVNIVVSQEEIIYIHYINKYDNTTTKSIILLGGMIHIATSAGINKIIDPRLASVHNIYCNTYNSASDTIRQKLESSLNHYLDAEVNKLYRSVLGRYQRIYIGYYSSIAKCGDVSLTREYGLWNTIADRLINTNEDMVDKTFEVIEVIPYEYIDIADAIMDIRNKLIKEGKLRSNIINDDWFDYGYLASKKLSK